ncbi:MAG: hypothetical protein QM730_19505 [Anaerolineales bacterium]
MNYLPGIIVVILIITGLTEMFVSATWKDVYFKAGIMVIYKNISVYPHHTNIPSRDLLEKRFKSGWFSFTSSLKFRELDTNIYAFREGLFTRSLSLVHGVLVFDDENHQVIVKGFYNWTLFCFWVMWLIFPPLLWFSGFLTFYDPPEFIIGVYLFVTLPNLGIPYLIDYVRLSRVAAFAAQLWSRKYTPVNNGSIPMN